MIQTLLTQTEFTDFADLNSVELDGIDLTNRIFQKLLYVPEVMNMISAKLNTGEALPSEILLKIKNCKKNKLFDRIFSKK